MANIYGQWIYTFMLLEWHTFFCFFALSPSALIFDGSVNPAHPKHIGSIDPTCDVVEVVKGNEWSVSAPVLLSVYIYTHTLDVICSIRHLLFVQICDCLNFNYLIFLESVYWVVCKNMLLWKVTTVFCVFFFFVSLCRCIWDFKDAVWAVLPDLSWYGYHWSKL